MSCRIVLRPSAQADLIALHRWIQGEADRPTADAYLDRIATRIASLADFPLRGTPRDDLSAGLRTIGFERRVIIAYRVVSDEVTVLRIVSAARELGMLLR